MNKKYIIGGLMGLAILCGIQIRTTEATTCLFPGQGGTGICTVATSTIGENLYVSSTTTIGSTTIPLYGFQANGSGGGISTGTPIYYVAASNAPQFEKNQANVVCSGVDDGACINTAINYVSSTYGSGIIQLSDGSFNVSSTIVNTKNFIGLNGDGPSSTQLNMAATDLLGIHFGNAQSSTNDVTDYLSNLTVNGNSTSSTGIWMDGWGSGSYMNNVYIDSNVKYGVIIEDADRVSMDNVRASGGYVDAMDFRTGIVNTNGKILVTNSEAGVTYNNSVGVEFDNDADQGSPNPLDVIQFNNLHMQENSGVSSGTCMDFLHPDGVRDLTMTNSQFEDCDTQINTQGNEVDAQIGPGVSFINSLKQSAYILYAPGYANITFESDEFQEVTTAFYGGGVNLSFIGTSKNNGNITNLFGGSFGYRGGTDTAFAGSSNLVLGQYNAPYNQIYGQQVNYNNGTLNTQASPVGSNVTAANQNLEVDNGTQGQLGGINAISVNNEVAYPLGSGIDFGTFANEAYASSSQSFTLWMATSTSFTTPIVEGTNGKFMDIDCAPGTKLSFAVNSTSSYALTGNEGTQFPLRSHILTEGCSWNSNTSFPNTSSPNGIYLGGSNGSRDSILEDTSVHGFNIGVNYGTNSYMDKWIGGLIETNIQNFNFASYSDSGENDTVELASIVDPANNSSTNCFVLQSSAVSNLSLIANSFDDCQEVIGTFNGDVNAYGNHHENSDTTDYGSSANAVSIAASSQYNDFGDIFQNDASHATSSWTNFYSVASGGTLALVGTTFQADSGYTVTSSVALAGTAHFSEQNVNNLSSAFTYIYGTTPLSSFDNSQSGLPTLLSSTTIVGNATATTLTVTATSTFLGNVSTTIAANSFVATNGKGILISTGTPSGLASYNVSVGSYLGVTTTTTSAALTVSSTLASTTFGSFSIASNTGNAIPMLLQAESKHVFTSISCSDQTAGTSTFAFGVYASITSTNPLYLIATGTAGNNGLFLTSFVSSTIGAGQFYGITSTVASTPTVTSCSAISTKQ